MTDKVEKTGEKLARAGKNGNVPPPEHRFKKGFDPRRNMRGVPRDVIEMRKHMRKIAAEIIGGDDTAMTRLDAMLRQLFTSRNPAHNKLALQVLNPKILTEHIDLSIDNRPIVLEWRTYDDDARRADGASAANAPSAKGDTEQ